MRKKAPALGLLKWGSFVCIVNRLFGRVAVDAVFNSFMEEGDVFHGTQSP